MGCKKPLRITILIEGREHVINGVFHPRGCMRARQSHLDLEPLPGTWLWSIALHRGYRLRCRPRNGCISLEEPLLGLEARLCPLGGHSLRCGGEVYVMITRGHRLYVGPVEVAWAGEH